MTAVFLLPKNLLLDFGIFKAGKIYLLFHPAFERAGIQLQPISHTNLSIVPSTSRRCQRGSALRIHSSDSMMIQRSVPPRQ